MYCTYAISKWSRFTNTTSLSLLFGFAAGSGTSATVIFNGFSGVLDTG